MRSGVQGVRLHEGEMRGLHVLAAILAAVMTVMAGHAVTTLHCLIRRRSSETVKRIDCERRNEQRHEYWPGNTHHLKEYMSQGGVRQAAGQEAGGFSCCGVADI
jgi:hypothetical protein